MSPADIHCLLEYFVFPDGSPDIHYRSSESITYLESLGAIQDNGTRFVITARGKAHVVAFCRLQWPHRYWLSESEAAKIEELRADD